MITHAFQLVVLGCTGGPRETNVSGYLISPLEQQEWIVCDAGSLLAGIDCALAKNNLKSVSFTDETLTPAAEMLNRHIRCFLISHAHLDHVSGLVLNSQIDGNKYILGVDSTIDNIRDHLFNGRIWPNYGSEGAEPVLRRYRYLRLPLHKQKEIPNTSMSVEAYLLSHPNGSPSSAFLIEYKGEYILYLGDTSSDLLEKEKNLTRVWHRIAPLLQENKLHGILLECSFPQKDADQVIYGHLDTKLMIKELHALSQIAGVSLKGLKVMVTHRKETLKKGPDALEAIKAELLAMNDLGVDFLFPTQGDSYSL